MPTTSTSGDRPTFFTIGHSARSVAELAGMLGAAGVERVVDVRAFPRSRTNPQFNTDVLAESLRPHLIDYVHVAELGGRRGRQPTPGPLNAWWTHRAFRNYADYALGDAFRRGFARLLQLGAERPSALMCSEAVWWRCHRRLIADYLLAAGHPVLHILSARRIDPAVLTPAARRDGCGGLVYPADPEG
jgi:uncharacterized protein (DUF488 family)